MTCFFLEIIEIDTLLINNQCLSTFFKFWNDKVEKNTTNTILNFFLMFKISFIIVQNFEK